MPEGGLRSDCRRVGPQPGLPNRRASRPDVEAGGNLVPNRARSVTIVVRVLCSRFALFLLRVLSG